MDGIVFMRTKTPTRRIDAATTSGNRAAYFRLYNASDHIEQPVGLHDFLLLISVFELYSFVVRNNCGGGKILCGNRLRGDAFFNNKKEMSNDLKIFREFLEKGDEKKKSSQFIFR